MNVTVTGGSGMTGSYLLYHLAEKGYEITAFKRENSDIKNTEKIFMSLSGNGKKMFSKINWTNGDLTDYLSVEKAVKDAETVYHTAATVSFKPKDRKKIINDNVSGTANVVNACLAAGVKKLCHVSSVAAVGNSLNGEPVSENNELSDIKNISDYAASKFLSEREVWRGIAEGLNAVIVNPSIILGTGNWEKGSPGFVKTIRDGLNFYTEGINGFVDVRDTAKIMIMLAESEISGERFILNSENISYKELFTEIAENLNVSPPKIKSKKYMLYSLMYFDKIRYALTGKEPRLTKYTLKSATEKHFYSNKKIKETLKYDFIPVKETVKYICSVFLNEIKSN